ncbi:hypothetical protein TTHERM_00193210 (macronuclear) [Tetrahymena thermophila SB210]|uniref:Uncharacterized protein n=1 Tax=Tetrahymena thermophila (strain SB210) TaxID=312017 RepID=Q23KL4_TETTS|nr:hypothetical protein TTHERM_00193210 [Tetrahymena thermophila SB210]EAR96829.1 hypothetical protein TTHERM_00193210 [Tetrahymena thermophila SB210]|eukprot:XP_001017074.1 hypothetical protein TTHERM_00193210 [Tetrahymena thermophila SB210]
MSNLVINQLQVQLNQTIENIQAHQHLIILVRLGSQVRRTQVWSGDKFQGQWSDDIRLNRSTEDSLEIRLSALETPQSSSGQLLGVAKIPFSQIQSSSVIQDWFPLIIKEQEAGKVYAKIQYLGDQQINLGTPSHALAGMQRSEQRTQYSQYQTQSPTFASSNNQVPAGSGFSQYSQSVQMQQQPQQQVVQSQTTGLPQGYQVYQGSPAQEQGQNLVSPQSQHQIYVQNIQGSGLPTQEQIIQQIQNRFQQHQVPQSQYPPRQVVQFPQQQQQQQLQYVQQPPPQPLTIQQFQQLQLQKASQQPQVIQVGQNQLGQQVQYVQQPQNIQAQQQIVGGYQVQQQQQQQQQYAPYQAQQQQQQQNKYRVNSLSTLQPRQQFSGVERQSSSQLRLLPYDQVQQQQVQVDDMQGLVNAFDNQLVIHNPPAVIGLPQQQTDYISQQPLMQSVVRLVPSSQYQEQLQQSPSQQVVHISGQPLIQEIQQPQFQTLSNSQLRLVPISQVQHQQQQQQQLQQQAQPVQGITLLGRQNISQQQQVQQQPIQQQVNQVSMQIPGQPLSNSQIRIIPLNQAQQIQAAQQQQQQIISYQPQQQQVQYAYSPQVQYVNQQVLPQQGFGMQQGSLYQQQQQLTPGVQLISQPYGQLQYQQ